MQANASEVTTTDNAPAVFSTITGDDWRRSLIEARARREDALNREHAQIINNNLSELTKTK